MPMNWAKQWKDAKTEFKTLTGKKKPNAHVEKTFSKHAAGLEGLIKKVDTAYTKAENANPLLQKDIDDFKTAIAAFEDESEEYVKVLEAAVNKEIDDKGEKTTYSKACKYLEKKLGAIHATMETQVGWLDSKLAGLSVKATMAANLIKTIQSTAKKCVAAAAKVKTDPTKANFDTTIYTPARDLSQNLGNIKTLRQQGYIFDVKYTNDKAQALYDMIRPYGD